MELTNQEFQQIVAFMRNHFGINLKEKRTLIEGRLENYLIKNGYHSYAEYMKHVEGDVGGAEAKALVNYLTTNHTYFMREPVHFQFMKSTALPMIAQRERENRSIRIWSAASSTGEEPYTIVMLLHEFFRMQQGKWDTRILATDISQRALEKAKKGVYLEEQLQGVSETWRKAYFERYSDTEFRLRDEIRNDVIYRTQNLMEPFHFRSRFHIVFLRNVMIYFEEETKRRLIEKMYEVLEPGGYLFIGTTEVLDKDNCKLRYIQPSIYQKM